VGDGGSGSPGARPERLLAFATASYVGRAANYDLSGGWVIEDPVDPYLGGWSRYSRMVTETFRPLEGFAVHFDAILADIARAGFRAVEIWGTHLDPSWATAEHVQVAQEALERHGLTTVAYGADFGSSAAEAVAALEIANALGSPIFGSYPGPFLDRDREQSCALVRDHGLRMVFENHPQHPTPKALLEEIGDDETIGALVDTGWWGTHGYDAADALRILGDRVYHVHLKDVVRPGTHDPCRLGEGCVPITRCLEVLDEIGYDGAITLEHLTANIDPTEDCRVMLQELEAGGRFAGR
jgi:L-ribulose-5-phosphate 3-epimerase